MILNIYLRLIIKFIIMFFVYYLGLHALLPTILDLFGFDNSLPQRELIFADSLESTDHADDSKDTEGQPFYNGFWIGVITTLILVGLVTYFIFQPSPAYVDVSIQTDALGVDVGTQTEKVLVDNEVQTEKVHIDIEVQTDISLIDLEIAKPMPTFNEAATQTIYVPTDNSKSIYPIGVSPTNTDFSSAAPSPLAHLSSSINNPEAIYTTGDRILSRSEQFGVPILTGDIERTPILRNILLKQYQAVKGMNDAEFSEWLKTPEALITLSRSRNLHEPLFSAAGQTM